MTSWIGQQFGKYIIHEELGRGGMARVFRATDTHLQRSVALKILLPALAADPEYSQRFEREAVTAANLHHPNIVTIFDVGEVQQIAYIAMEYVAGRTLQAVIDERGKLGLGYAVALLLPVADALDYAHTHQAVHRDIKPHNIMINADGRVVLMDFGIAQAPIAGTQRLTRSGVFMGTPEYIAPEQAGAGPVDGRSDLYSLGIVAFEIITGRVPFTGTVPELLVAHSYTPAPAVSALLAGAPATLDTIFERALAKKPEQRPPSARAFIDAIRVVAERTGSVIPDLAAVAALSVPQGSSAGKATMAIPSGVDALPLVGRHSSDVTDVGVYKPALPAKPIAAPVQAKPAAADRAQAAASAPAPRTTKQPVRSAPVARRRSIQRQNRAAWVDRVRWMLPVVVVFLFVVLGLVVWRQGNPIQPLRTPLPNSNGLNGPFLAIPTNTRLATFIPTFEIIAATQTRESLLTPSSTMQTPEVSTETIAVPTPVPSTPVPPTPVPPTPVPPTPVPPTPVPPTPVPPTPVPPTPVPLTPASTLEPPTPVPPTLTPELPTVTPEAGLPTPYPTRTPVATTETLPESTAGVPTQPTAKVSPTVEATLAPTELPATPPES